MRKPVFQSQPHASFTGPVSRAVLLVGAPSASLERKRARLANAGYDLTVAENVCYAEMLSEVQYFDAAIYDDSLAFPEQISLARVMRVRWPWMRLISCGIQPGDGLFDATEFSEPELPEVLQKLLT